MENLEEQVKRFKKPTAQEGVSYLEQYIEEKMPAVKDDIRVMSAEQLKVEKGGDLQTAKLINFWHEAQQNTKYCSFRLGIRTTGKWYMADTSNDHNKAIVIGDDLNEVLREAISFIEIEREPAEDSVTYDYQMKCPSSGYMDKDNTTTVNL